MRSRLRLVTLLVTAAVALTLTSGQAQQGAIVESLALQDTAKDCVDHDDDDDWDDRHGRGRDERR